MLYSTKMLYSTSKDRSKCYITCYIAHKMLYNMLYSIHKCYIARARTGQTAI